MVLLQFIVSSDATCSCDDIEFEDEIIIGTIPLAPALPPELPPVYTPEPEDTGKKKKKQAKKKQSKDEQALLDVLEGRRRSAAESIITGICIHLLQYFKISYVLHIQLVIRVLIPVSENLAQVFSTLQSAIC